MQPITAEAFAQAFHTAWQEACAFDRPGLMASYAGCREYTRRMLESDTAIITRTFSLLRDRVGADPTLALRHQWYTLDAVLIAGTNLFGQDMSYPSRLEALIEHENGDNWEEEMWKLLFWRAPLKVLIGYDYCEADYAHACKIDGEARTKGDWLPHKISKLRDMHQTVTAWHPESNTQYLLLVGNKARRDLEGDVQWRWCRLDQPGALMPLEASAAIDGPVASG